MDDVVELSQQQNATLFESINDVLHPLAATNKPRQKETNLTKKLEKGDGAWATRTIVLGWLLDTVRWTIELPLHGKECLQPSSLPFLPTNAAPPDKSGNSCLVNCGVWY